jgi:eukaryotic-like serine/threonine-protein kinase
MAYCPECGSEVAQIDVFCPYCGIQLPNVAQVPAADEVASKYSPTSDLAQEVLPTENVVSSVETQTDPNVESESETSLEDEIADQDTVKTIEAPPTLETTVEETEQMTAAEPPIEAVKADTEKPAETEIAEPPTEIVSSSASENEAEADYIEEQIPAENFVQPVETPIYEIDSDDSLNDDVDLVIEEISHPDTELTDEPLSAVEEKENEFVAPISNGFASDEVAPAELNSIPTPMPLATEIEEEDKLQSVLEEIDLNLKNQNQIEAQKAAAPIEDTGVVIPTAASLQEDFQARQNLEESISEPLASFVPLDQEVEIPEPGSEVQAVLPISQDLPPVVANLPTPVVNLDSAPNLATDDEKEGRAFTNPNIAGTDTDNRTKTKLKPLEEGTTLNNRYEVVRKIGGGGMGAVYLATDKNLGGVLRAVKEMVQSYIEDDQQEKAVNDFKRESLLLTSLEHSAIPTIYDYFYDEKEARFYLVMKYISGGDLAARLRSAPEGRIDEVSVTDWAIQITDVLDYLHNRQPPIVYRDLKPSNIMIDGNSGKVMIIDFGIARWVNKEEKGVTAVGTMGYAPPELFSGNVEPRSDIYSLGSTMFHLLTGADPQSNPLLIFDFNKNPKPRQINSQLSDQMEQILMRAVEYNSTNRFNTAAEMCEALKQHKENLKKGMVTFGVVNTSASSPINANVPVFCGFCGQKIVATDMFCPFCGAQQPLAAQSQKIGQPPPVYSAPTIFPKLAIVGTSDLDSTDYILEKDSNLLGRRDPMSNIFPEVDLSKFDPQTKISRKHARIWREGDVYMLEDLGSSNGTVLISATNGSVRLLPRQPQVLSHGDKVKVGDTTLRFSIG